MKKATAFLILALLGASVFPAQSSADFSRAIAYYLIGDLDLARKNLDAHFQLHPQPTIKLGFVLLLQDEKWEATKKFRDYLESDHRSLEALTGISLATADMKNSLAIDNLNKILRMNPGYAPAYLGLGHEYALRNNFPAAEEYFSKSLKYDDIPEFKILLADLYLKTAEAQKAFDLIRPEADRAPANYYFALLAARACLQLNGCPDTALYIERAMNARPESREAQLLHARHLLKIGELRKAKALLGKLKFDRYNPEYGLTFAEVLLQLKDRDAEKYLYEVFSQEQWQPLVNKLLGLFHLRKKDDTVQNWIDRAVLSGLPAQELRKEFPAQYNFPAYPFFPIFDVKKIQWLGNRRILIAGCLNSGEKEKLLVLDAGSLKTVKSFEYEGSIQEIFPAARLDKVIFSTTAAENEKVYLYTLVAARDTYILKPVVGYALNMPKVLAAFSESGNTAYVTDGSLPDLAFISPFSAVSAYGKKTAIYPAYPFPVYSYSYASGSWKEIRRRDELGGAPLPDLQNYLLVAAAYQHNPEVARLLDKGRNIDITSSEEMKLHFSESASHFLIHFSDLKNAFQAWAYDQRSNKLIHFDEAMFLGEKYYSDLDIVAFHPEKYEILVRTRDKQKNLVLFNYRSLLYKRIGGNILAAAVSPDLNFIYALAERNNYMYFSDANLEIIRLAPYDRKKINSRRDLNAIVDCSDLDASYFATYNGELLKLDESEKFSRRQVSLAGAVYQPSPDKRKAAAFINGRLYVLDWLD
jgi:thioredoxin-like negative regulator of GroEL